LNDAGPVNLGFVSTIEWFDMYGFQQNIAAAHTQRFDTAKAVCETLILGK
jgi:hypothetical protein